MQIRFLIFTNMNDVKKIIRQKKNEERTFTKIILRITDRCKQIDEYESSNEGKHFEFVSFSEKLDALLRQATNYQN